MQLRWYCAHYIGMDDGVHQKYDKLVYKRPEGPVSESSVSEGILVDSAVLISFVNLILFISLH